MEVLKEGLLKVDPGLFLWTVITFIVLFLILWKAAWKPIVDALDARAEKVRSDIENAEMMRIEAEKQLAQHKEMMEKANSEVASIIAEGKAEAERIRSAIIEKANAEAREISEKAKKEIEMAKDKALAEIQTEIVTISTEIAAKIIAKNLNPEDQKKLVEDAISKIGTVQ
ncbi:MAG: F0F1 ATP synthase subunit B [Spirochaetes bacterium]|nr:F0F1 ATP synthase subunit B [Spirochaetota bacterium]